MVVLAFMAEVPEGVGPGEQFLADCEGTRVWVEVPAGVSSGQKVQFIRPESVNEVQLDDEVRGAFNQYDLDGDGVISPPELKQLLLSLGFESEEGELLFRQGDCNEDGELNIAEFSYLYEKLKTKLAERECAEMKKKHQAELDSIQKKITNSAAEHVEQVKAEYHRMKANREQTLAEERRKQKIKIEERLKQRKSAKKQADQANLPGAAY